MQGMTADGSSNLQVQINGQKGSSTIATVLVRPGVLTASTSDRQAFVARKSRNGLVESLNSMNIHSVTGNCN